MKQSITGQTPETVADEPHTDDAASTAAQAPTFEALGLAPEILEAVRRRGYERPTPIQAEAIPLVLKGRDLMGLAQTGTGKTAAFTLPIINRLIGGPRRTRALVLAPTRELAIQVEESVRNYAADSGLDVIAVFG